MAITSTITVSYIMTITSTVITISTVTILVRVLLSFQQPVFHKFTKVNDCSAFASGG